MAAEKTNGIYMVKIPTAMNMFSRGRNRMIDDAKKANAYIKTGRSCLVIVPKMQEYYENLACSHMELQD